MTVEEHLRLEQAMRVVAKVAEGNWKPGDPPTSEEHWDAVCLLAFEYLRNEMGRALARETT